MMQAPKEPKSVFVNTKMGKIGLILDDDLNVVSLVMNGTTSDVSDVESDLYDAIALAIRESLAKQTQS